MSGWNDTILTLHTIFTVQVRNVCNVPWKLKLLIEAVLPVHTYILNRSRRAHLNTPGDYSCPLFLPSLSLPPPPLPLALSLSRAVARLNKRK